jgi:hypothetical protein
VIAAPPAALTAAPARIELAGAARQVVRVTNSGRTRVVIDASQAGFALGLRGRPRVVRSDPAARLSIRPQRLALRPGETGAVSVASSAARGGGAAGDHPALVLLTAKAPGANAIGVRLRLGIRVVVRLPGAVVHRLALGTIAVRRRAIDIVVWNRGNVVEQIGAGNVRVRLRRGGLAVATLEAPQRELLPGALGMLTLRLPRARGALTALVELWPRDAPAKPARRVVRLRGGG